MRNKFSKYLLMGMLLAMSEFDDRPDDFMEAKEEKPDFVPTKLKRNYSKCKKQKHKAKK